MQRSCGTLASFSIGETRFVQPATAHSFDLRIGVACRALHSDPLPTPRSGNSAPESRPRIQTITVFLGRPPSLPFSRDAAAFAEVLVTPPAFPISPAIHLREPKAPSSNAGR